MKAPFVLCAILQLSLTARKPSPPGSAAYCAYPSLPSAAPIHGRSIKRVFDCPLLAACETLPVKRCGNHLTPVSYFPALNRIRVNKHPLGNTVKVLLVLSDEKGKGSEKIPKHE